MDLRLAAAAQCLTSRRADPSILTCRSWHEHGTPGALHHCPNCGAGELKIIPAILERPVIQKIVDYLGLDPQPSPKAPNCRAREPEQPGANFAA